MTNPAGTRAETACARWLTEETGEPFHRLPRYGKNDRGDVWAPGHPWLCCEVKNTKTVDLRGWRKELTAECRNAAATHGVVLWSPPGVGLKDPGKWLAIEYTADRPALRPWRRSLPHVGTLNRLHKYVAAVDAWGKVVCMLDGSPPPGPGADADVVCQLAAGWVKGLQAAIAVKVDSSQDGG